ncbi:MULTISPECIES: hypothetical protein [Stenotrophomonas]|uniref:hypothetical protein n=1 Tax=Stenotrophomonas TaxID=40323 RepID=UPI00131F0147|nr:MULTISPECIES: hypothetical protein [Stenotrophomonas]
MRTVLRHSSFNCLLVSAVCLAGCGTSSTLSEVEARHIADKNVEECFGRSGVVDPETAFTGRGQFKQGWMFEYKFDGELCAILVGYDGGVELSATKE